MNNNLEAGEFNIELKEEEPVWMDKKRYTIFALPISFTTYYLTPTKILIESGLLLQEKMKSCFTESETFLRRKTSLKS